MKYAPITNKVNTECNEVCTEYNVARTEYNDVSTEYRDQKYPMTVTTFHNFELQTFFTYPKVTATRK